MLGLRGGRAGLAGGVADFGRLLGLLRLGGSVDVSDGESIEARRRDLVRIRGTLLAVVEATAEGVKPVDLDEPIGRISRVDAMQQQKMLAENRQAAQRRRRQVEAALGRIEDGEYGECLACGEEIDPRRLEAHPEAPFCIECQGRRETSG